MRKGRSCLRTHIDCRARAGRQFPVPGNKVGVQMALKNVPDGDAMVRSSFQVQLHIPLRIDDDGFAFRGQQVGSVRQTSQIELFEIHRSPPVAYRC